MKILLVEDSSQMQENYRRVILNYNKDIALLFAHSFEDLERKMLTEDFDLAIIDMNLKTWGDASVAVRENGRQICDHLFKTRNFGNPERALCLYSAFDITRDHDTRYMIERKLIGPNVSVMFRDKILARMVDKDEVELPVTMGEFLDYPHSRKSRYYKNVLQKFKEHHGPFSDERYAGVLWTSNIHDEQSTEMASVLQDELVPELFPLSYEYEDLDNHVRLKHSAPTIFWNYAQTELIDVQKRRMQLAGLRNQFIRQFFNISLAQSLAGHLLDQKKSDVAFERLLQHLEGEPPSVLRETQCRMIDLLSLSEPEDQVRSGLSKLIERTGFRVADYFEASLDSFDLESDVACVRLVSKLDPKRYYTREFSYKRLRTNDVKFKEDRFQYCVSEYEGQVAGYIEPL